MLSNAKKNLRVDKVAGKGAVFFTTRTGGGHVGFVTAVNGNKFETIEGNTNTGQGYGV
jgi:surface antigen